MNQLLDLGIIAPVLVGMLVAMSVFMLMRMLDVCGRGHGHARDYDHAPCFVLAKVRTSNFVPSIWARFARETCRW